MGNAPIPLDFGIGSEPGRHGPDAGAMHWNCFVQPVKGGKSETVLRAADGTRQFALVTSNGSIRGMHTMAGSLYVVSGTQLFKVDVYGGLSVIGGIPGTGKVVMTRNDAATPQLVIITDEGERYVCAADAVTAISDADLPTPIYATYLNQRVIYTIADGRLFFSAVDDVTDIDPLDTFTAEGNPDGAVAGVAHLQELWVFGADSLEVWRETGDPDTPFRRNDAGVIPRGCLNKHTIKAIDIDLFWIGDDRKVYRARGYQAEQIATEGVLEAIRTTEDPDTIEAMTLTLWGHDFYVLSGPDWTWAFNRTTQAWDPRVSYGRDRWFASVACWFEGMQIVGDVDGPNLYILDRDAHDEAGTKMVWRARTSPMHGFPHRLSVDRLYLDLVTGVGLNSSDAHESAPKVGLRWSDDGGKTWSRQRIKPLGAIGSRSTVVSFDGLGTTSRTGRIWEVEMSSPVIRSLMYAAVEGDPIGT